MDMEDKMDKSFLLVGADDNNDYREGGGDKDGGERGAAGGLMLQFGNRVDKIIDAALLTLLAFADENGDVMTESNRV
jgi:hypothetical protein